jgi:hypothetical protein
MEHFQIEGRAAKKQPIKLQKLFNHTWSVRLIGCCFMPRRGRDLDSPPSNNLTTTATMSERLTRSFREYITVGHCMCLHENWHAAQLPCEQALKVAKSANELRLAHEHLYRIAVALDIPYKRQYHAKRMIRFAPDHPKGYLYFGKTLAQSGTRNDLEEALRLYRRGLKHVSPEDPLHGVGSPSIFCCC